MVVPSAEQPRAASVAALDLPRRTALHPSAVDWRDEVLYFLLVDRFSDGRNATRPLLDRTDLPAARPAGWRWDAWARSGGDRWQGGTIAGVTAELDYLATLGVTTLWLSPVFKQRAAHNTYHGYAIQDFLDVDPRFGTRADLVDLVSHAHADHGMRVILDVVFQHTGMNWVYDPATPGGPRQPTYTTGRHGFGHWLDADDQPRPTVTHPDDGIWPAELQDPDSYTRAGSGDLGRGDIGDDQAEHKRTDFLTLRDLALGSRQIDVLARCLKYWIALTDCDGFRLDTLKHVTFEQARNLCGSVREFAANVGKANFLLLGEVAGGDDAEDRYLDALGRNLSAALDIGAMRPALTAVAKGLAPAPDYFAGFDPERPGAPDPSTTGMGSHRNVGNRHVSILDDHDHVFGSKLRFSTNAASGHQVVAGVAIQLLSLGIPCLYYGTEQAFAGPERSEHRWLPGWGSDDRYLREAMFGPDHPRASGAAGRNGQPDPALPGFGPFGTAGHHCFDPTHPAFTRIAGLIALRQARPVLRHGRQYLRPIARGTAPFGIPGSGDLVAWSRILDDEEALCVVNAHGTEPRHADVLIDASLNAAAPRPGGGRSLQVIHTTDPTLAPLIGSSLPVGTRDGVTSVALPDIGPSEVVILSNR